MNIFQPFLLKRTHFLYNLIWKSCLVSLIFTELNAQVTNNSLSLKFISDSGFNSIAFGTLTDNDKVQIYQLIKSFGSESWGPQEIISDPEVSVHSYEIKRDSNDNIVVGWLGENTDLGIYCLYMKYFLSSTGQWSSISMLSDSSQNLVGSFALSINTKSIEALWTVYTEEFLIENRTFSVSIID